MRGRNYSVRGRLLLRPQSRIDFFRSLETGWTPKAYKEREIPIPTKFVKSLKVWKAKSDKICNFVFRPLDAIPSSASSTI
jgi:hypothetical protein